MTHVYISHSPVDLDPLLLLHEALRQAGMSAWYPPSPAAASNDALVSQKLGEAFAMVVLISADAMRSASVQREIETALAEGVPIVPFRLDKARLSGVIRTELAASVRYGVDDAGGVSGLVEHIRQIYRRRCPVIAVMNLKGGVGKTTLTAQVFAMWQAEARSRVLLVDLDPQYNLTQLFLDMEVADERAARDRSVISLFEKSQLHSVSAESPAGDWSGLSREPFNLPAVNQLVYPLLGAEGPEGRLDLITGQFEISKYAFATDAEGLADVKRNFLGQMDALRSRYDLIVFDTNPNATFLTQCALQAADRVLAPMHPDIYSLRGVRLLAQVIREQVPPEAAPEMSVVFNGVHRREQSDFEADVRNGVHDGRAGFLLSRCLIGTAVPRSNHLAVKAPEDGVPAWRQLLVHHGRGGGLAPMREALQAVAMELSSLSGARPEPV